MPYDPTSRALFEDMGYAGGGANGSLRWKDLALNILLPIDHAKEEAEKAAQARKMASGAAGNQPQAPQQPAAQQPQPGQLVPAPTTTVADTTVNEEDMDDEDDEEEDGDDENGDDPNGDENMDDDDDDDDGPGLSGEEE